MEIGINAKIADILDRLERDMHRISNYRFGDHILVTYSSIRNNNIVTIYSRVFLNGEAWNYVAPGNVAVSYEVFRETETRSSIKYFHDQNINHERLCYLYLARLYQAMGAEGEIEMRQKYEELEAVVNEGKHWGHINGLRVEVAGMTMEAYGWIPNTPGPVQDATDVKVSAQVGLGEPEDKTVKDTQIPVGKFDDLCLLWVNRPYIPRQNKDDFLSDHASELDKKSFDRILKDAHKREIIDKGPGKKGRYKPKTVS